MTTFAEQIVTEADAYELLESLRWPSGRPEECPKCAARGTFYFLAPKDGAEGRKTRTGAVSERRVWTCGTCRKQFSVLTATVLQGTRVSVRTWLLVIDALCKMPLTTAEIGTRFHLSRQTVHKMIQKLKVAAETPDSPLNGLLIQAANNHHAPKPPWSTPCWPVSVINNQGDPS